VCVVGKNYRLQDIQLSKTYDLQRLGWLAGPPPLPRSSGGRLSSGLPTVAHAPEGKRERRLVENTGLEPVTSWLQTRRSPS
jgi:hypothetical protein